MISSVIENSMRVSAPAVLTNTSDMASVWFPFGVTSDEVVFIPIAAFPKVAPSTVAIFFIRLDVAALGE